MPPSLQVSISEAMIAQCSPPPSEPDAVFDMAEVEHVRRGPAMFRSPLIHLAAAQLGSAGAAVSRAS